jgi:uncharacterized protein with NAD-binding domain and iron-sulfur cluster
MSSLTTVFELTNQPGWRDRWDITVYQQGWRLGGKGASGRNPDAYQRIEEHGLHVLFGFYDNAFRVLKQVYRELGRNPQAPLATWQDAFKPHDLIVMMEELDGQWIPWPVACATNTQEPGGDYPVPEPWQYFLGILKWNVDKFHEWSRTTVTAPALDKTVANHVPALRNHIEHAIASERAGAAHPGFLQALEEEAYQIAHAALGDGFLGGLEHEVLFLDLAHEVARKLSADVLEHVQNDHDVIIWVLRKFADWFWERPENDLATHRLRLMTDFSLAILVGLLRDQLVSPPQDWFKIDDLDFRAWLKKNGAHDETLRSPIVTGLYDAIFSACSEVGAGTIVHLLLRMGFSYRGSVLWKMQAGMGDTVFTPLYTVLKRRGVKFEFFHNVNQLELSNDKQRIERIVIGRQATLKDGEYDPLIEVNGLPSWPSRPFYEQLVEGDRIRDEKVDLEDWWANWPDIEKRVLTAGNEFDIVVLGISIGAFPYICKELIADNERFRDMVESVATCQTRALQLWFTPDLAGLGWQGAPPVTIPFAEPYDTWADMSHLIPREAWPPELPVGNIAYLCAQLEDREPLPPRDDHDYPKRQDAHVKEQSKEWLCKHAGALWPFATQTNNPCELNWYWLVDPLNRAGAARLDAQYWRAPTNPSERYVLSVPKSSLKRLRADESGYANLVLTGDWTFTPLNAGCLEAATIAGLSTARALGAQVKIAGDWTR